MASTSAGKYISDSEKELEYEVFLSFRGPDTRDFVDHLFDGLKTTRFKAFLDNDGLEHGKDIQQKLYEAIRRSKMSVVILSSNYADSRWCLDELVEIMELHSLNVHDVLPVFFKVEPTVVRNQTDVYKNAFSKLKKRYKGEKERVEKWKSALKRVANLKGISKSADCSNSLLVKTIIQDLEKFFSTRSRLYVPQYIVGRKEILEDISMWLQDGSSDVEVGLIYGLGGIGKSTIAKIAYNSNYRTFDSSSFLEDFTIRKASQSNGIACILKAVISEVTGKPANEIYSEGKGIIEVKSLLKCRRVLMVFDDVHELKDLHDSFNDPENFGNGSKIIITTRNQELRKVPLLKREFRVSELDRDDSKELLKVHAYIKNPLSQRQEELLDEFLRHCKGFPQALYVMGPVLRYETEESWKSKLEELEEYKDPKLLSVFKLSYESLGDKSTKDLFLYVACFFIGMDKEYSLKILKGCKLQRPMTGLQNLVDRCLLTIDYRGKLMMHQSIEEMGKDIVHLEDTTNPGRRRILWRSKDSTYVLQNDEGTRIIQGLRLYLPKPDNHTSSEPQYNFESWLKRICLGLNFWNPWRYISTLNLMSIRTSSFTLMSNLELLLLNHVQLEGGYADFPKKIKWLLWPGCPLQSIPSNFNLNELVVLDMQKSCLVHAWKACKYMGALKVLNLSYSDHLVCTPDLSCALMLEWLYLEGCTSLEKVHKSIGNLSNLAHLNLKGCTILVEIHRSIETLKKLTMLNLTGCESLESFPIPSSVVQLNLAGCRKFFMACNRMQSSVIGRSSPSKILSTSPLLPFNIYLPLKELNLKGWSISREDILGLLSCAPSLKRLDLSDNPIVEMCPTPKLTTLVLDCCTKLRSISQLPRRCMLYASNCPSLKRISYIYYYPNYIPTIVAPWCHELLEVDYGCNDRLVVKWIHKLDESEANQLGFPNLHAIASRSILQDLINSRDRLPGIGRGFYRAGVYQVYLVGDHLAKWFNRTTTEAELLHTVSDNQLDIRALNLGFMLSVNNVGRLRYFYNATFTIKNVTRKWEWSLCKSFNDWLFAYPCQMTFTWLSHWRTVKEHREIKPGDLLHISVGTFGFHDIVTWGIKIIYEEQQQVDEDGSEQHNDDNVRHTDNSWSSSSSRSQNVNHIDKTVTSSIDGKRVDQEEEEDDSSTSVSNRYNNIFRSHLGDLSIYEYKRHSDNDEEDLNHKTREYIIPSTVNHIVLVQP